MRKIAVMEDFLTPERRKKVLDTAEKCGFAVDFYGRGAAPAQGLEDYEILYGWCNPQDLKRATGLKWYCCGFAGVDQLSDDSLYASPDVVLSNSSGAYGLTISEHILLVTLRLRRRAPAFPDTGRAAGMGVGAAYAVHLRQPHHGAGSRGHRHQFRPAGQGPGSGTHLRRVPQRPEPGPRL